MDLSKLASDINPYIKPFVVRWIGEIQSTSRGAPSPHDLQSKHHTGSISDAQGPQFLKSDGSRLLSGNLDVSPGITIDGVDLSEFWTAYQAHLSSDSHTQYASAAGSGILRPAEAVSKSVNAGWGLSGGGVLTDDVDISVDASSAPGSTSQVLKTNEDGEIILNRVVSDAGFFPIFPDTADLGSSSKPFRKGWLSEMDAVLFSKNTMTLLGGWFRVSKNEGVLPTDLTELMTTYDFGQSMTIGDFVLMKSPLQMEYIQIGSLVNGTIYNLTRNLDGSGVNFWPAGTLYVVNGQNGDGWIEFNAYDTPRMSIFRQGSTYSSQTENYRAGDLIGNWGYLASTFGIAIGEYANNKPNLTIDSTNGFRIRNYSTTVIQLDTAGNADITSKLRLPGTGSALAIGATPPTSSSSGTGGWIDRTGFYGLAANTVQAKWDFGTGKITAGAGAVILDQTGLGLVKTPSLIQGFYQPASITWWTDNKASIVATMGPIVDTAGSIGLSFWGEGGAGGTHYLGVLDYAASVINTIKLNTGAIIATSLSADGSGALAPTNSVSATNLYGTHIVKNGYEGSIFVPLQSPYTNTSWDGDSKSTTGKTLIGLNSFGVPSVAKAIACWVEVKDSGSSTTDNWICLSPNATAYSGVYVSSYGMPNDRPNREFLIVPCTAGGDLYYQTLASGAGTLDVVIQIWGYWI